MLGGFCLLKEELSAKKTQKSFVIYKYILKVLYLFCHKAIVTPPTSPPNPADKSLSCTVLQPFSLNKTQRLILILNCLTYHLRLIII